MYSNGSTYLLLLLLFHSAITTTKWDPTTLIFVHSKIHDSAMWQKQDYDSIGGSDDNNRKNNNKDDDNEIMAEFDEWTNNQHERFTYKQKGKKKLTKITYVSTKVSYKSRTLIINARNVETT